MTTPDAFTFPEEILKRNTSLFWVLTVSKEMKYCSNKYYSPHIVLTPPIEINPPTNVKNIFVPTKVRQILKLSPPIIMGGGGQKP